MANVLDGKFFHGQLSVFNKMAIVLTGNWLKWLISQWQKFTWQKFGEAIFKWHLGLLAKFTNGKYSTGTFACGILNERHLSQWQAVLMPSVNGKCLTGKKRLECVCIPNFWVCLILLCKS